MFYGVLQGVVVKRLRLGHAFAGCGDFFVCLLPLCVQPLVLGQYLRGGDERGLVFVHARSVVAVRFCGEFVGFGKTPRRFGRLLAGLYVGLRGFDLLLQFGPLYLDSFSIKTARLRTGDQLLEADLQKFQFGLMPLGHLRQDPGVLL